jgi:Na+/melibiose symporter-like transporter
MMNSLPASAESVTQGQGQASRIYQAGTLRYTTAGIVVLFAWLLWGDFCLYLMESVIPRVLPLQLKALGASGSLTTALLTVVPGVIGIVWNPVISTWSDRCRSRWGRRIPFMLAGTPLVVILLVALGWSDAIGATLHRMAPQMFSPAIVMMAVISVLVVGFYSCNVVVYNLYFSLFNDVVPREFMGRFAVLFRVIGTSAGAAFNILIFPHAQTHLREIYIGAALLYGVAYVMMCLKVKEGQYPPPPSKETTAGKHRDVIRSYFRECFSQRFYVWYFLSSAFYGVSALMMPFLLLMNLSLGLTMQQVGWINGFAAILSIPAFLVTGFLMERVGVLKLYFWMKVTQVVAMGGLMVFLFIELPPLWIVVVSATFNIMLLCVNAVLLVAGIPINMMLMPREQFAQFSSANALLCGACGIVGGVVGGFFIDAMKGLYTGSDFAYRYAPVWATVFAALSAFYFYKVYHFVTGTHGSDLTTFVPPPVVPISTSISTKIS